ncbi:MAG: carboxypeptidase-like regulatory domain-containing protein [Saprospiraceae bacterium]
MKYIIITFLFCLSITTIQAQSATVFGKVTDSENRESIIGATIIIVDASRGASTDKNGRYELKISANQDVIIEISYVNYNKFRDTINLKPGEKLEKDFNLELQIGDEVVVTAERTNDGMLNEGVEALELLPIASGNLESALPTLFMGVAASNELSSQYSVRGGNYDENLVYVNDFEIYRPFLIRSGQQEGLTFPNVDLIRDLSFSSGGFQAKYGDKMSSVLDITYKVPDTTRASVTMGLLGASAHVEGSVKKKSDSTGRQRLRYLFGARYKTNAYLLNSLDLVGEYNPQFTDFQGMITYDINDDWQLNAIGNYSRSVYQFVPESLTSTLGLVNFALQFRVAFDGQQVDDFTTGMGGLSLIYYPEEKNYFLKFLTSTYQSRENERFDLIGQYLLGQIETDLGSDNVGEIVGILGIGTEHNFARNYLTANVYNAQHKGGWEIKNENNGNTNFIEWGAKFQNETIIDELKEWELLDSAGYSIPFDTNNVFLSETIKTDIFLQSNRFSAFVQNTWNVRDSTKDLNLSYGVRAQYWDLNGEFIFSPRAQMVYRPLKAKRDVTFKVASGLYFQPPFYRELRNQFGEVNTDLLSQKSFHILAGGTWDFLVGDKEFRFIAESYYKYLWDLVAYDVDNVRIRYYGDNNASGYATGIDLRLNGEFVPGAESWVNLSFMRTRESFDGVQHLLRQIGRPNDTMQVADVPRPTDRLFSLSMLFQDYLPQNENFKMNLNLTVSSGVPFGLPNDNVVYRNTYRFNPYYRADIGFSALLWDRNKGSSWRLATSLRHLRKAWVSVEVFNLLDIQNTAANTWVKTIFSQQFAIPNYLTSRRINVRFRVDF